jgi:hypothetical protein
MAAWNDGYETDAIRLFVRDRSTQRIADANAERLASQIRAVPDESKQPMLAGRRHRRQHVHIRAPHFSH